MMNAPIMVIGQDRNTNTGDISLRLRQARSDLGLTQSDLAKIGGVSLNTQNRYEGGTSPPVEYLLRIGAAGADWFWIITGQHMETDPLDSQTAQLVQLYKTLPDFLKSIALAQVRVMADQIPPENLDTPPPPESDQQQATMHDQRQDYRHQ
ncbi:transcriptional regulator with XRE-family HTH domain [Sphingobium sp. B7D2B]|nr:transcriptional regulator with XRE-family HTH domain [Sphingobium sp. B7D2B]